MSPTPAHLSHYRARSAASASYKAGLIRKKRKALKQQGYDVIRSSTGDKKKPSGVGGSKKKRKKEEEEDTEGELKQTPEEARAVAEKRRKKEKRSYSRAKGKLSRVSGVLLSRIERRIEGEKGK